MQPDTTPNTAPPATPNASGAPLHEPRELAERAHRGIDRLRSSAHQTVDQAADAASSAADRMSARGEEWVAQGDEWMEATRGYVREHPLAAVGMALAAGYLLSRLSGR